MRRTLGLAVVLVSGAIVTAAENPESGVPVPLSGLRAAARVTRDVDGIAHIGAAQEHDLFFLQGHVHAEDRLFQMDLSRRQASGTLGEILGSAALSSDIQFRTIGLRRAAASSLEALSPRVRAALEAYASGVNAFVSSHPLPSEYAVLELTRFEPWTPLDSVTIAKLITFGLSFDLRDIELTVALVSYQQAGAILGFDGTALFFEDLFRSAPFDPAATVPDASAPPPATSSLSSAEMAWAATGRIHPATLALGRRQLDQVKDIPVFEQIRDRRGGSNVWAVSGAHTESGFPVLANDPHLALGTPSTFYPIHLRSGRMDVVGDSFAGVPFVVLGHNPHISWGATHNPMDVTDLFQEQIAVDPASPSGLSIVHQGRLEPIVAIAETFRQNNPHSGISDDVTVVPPGSSVPAVTLVVPRRNNGPILQIDPAAGVALSVQYTGLSATRELETFLIWNEATGRDDFVRGLQFFDVGSENWAYSDVQGNIAYFTSGEMPVREDLQAGVVTGLPPYFIRDGTGGNEWLAVQNPQPDQAVPFEILPFAEMPQIDNPPAGFFVSANNDPAGSTLDNAPLNQLRPGGGIYYLNPGYKSIRAGRITQLVRDKLSTGTDKLSVADMRRIQADTLMLDAQVFVPHIIQAFDRALAPGANPALAALAADPGIAEAVGRFATWDFTTPTGIPEGYDASDVGGVLSPPSQAEINASVAATLYAVWRGRILTNTIDAVLAPFGLPAPGGELALSALRRLLETFPDSAGVGASGLPFFNAPGATDPADRRDVVILTSLADSLALLAGSAFAAAFGGSTNQEEYRWGRLHRIVLEHPLGGPFSIPPAGGALPDPLPGLPGIPVDGGFESVDVASHDVRAADVTAFVFGHGPTRRFVSEAGPGRVRAESSLPGGTSGILGSPFHLNLLPAWLANETFPWLRRSVDAAQEAGTSTRFVPTE